MISDYLPWILRVTRATIRCARLSTGGVGPEPRVRGTSWGALTLEVGKSPWTTATRWRAELPVVYAFARNTLTQGPAVAR